MVGGPRIQGHNVTSLWAGTYRIDPHYTGSFDTWSREKYVYFLKANTSEENRRTSLFSALTCVNTEATGLLRQPWHRNTSVRYCYLLDNQQKPTCPEGHGQGAHGTTFSSVKACNLNSPTLLQEEIDKSPNVFPEQYQDDALHNKCGYSCEGWHPVATLRTCNKNCYKNNA